MEAYEGQGNYIFISYSHKDEKIVFPIIEKLQTQYNVWFDKRGLKYSDKYDNVIADHIAKCALFIFMVSLNSLKSDYCEFEINLAERKKRPFFNVLIEDCLDLPEADIFASKYSKKYHQAEFFKTGIDAFIKELPENYPDIIKCKKAQKVETKVVSPNEVYQESSKKNQPNNFEQVKVNVKVPQQTVNTKATIPTPKIDIKDRSNDNPFVVRANNKLRTFNEYLKHKQINIKCGGFNLGEEGTTYHFRCPIPYTAEDFKKVALALQRDMEYSGLYVVYLPSSPASDYVSYGLRIPNQFINRLDFEEVWRRYDDPEWIPLWLNFGYDRFEDPVRLDLANLNHMLVIGNSEKERNNFLNVIIASFLRRNTSRALKLALLNFSETGSQRYKNLPHLFAKYHGPNDNLHVLSELFQEAKRRMELDKPVNNLPPIVFIVKDYDLIMSLFIEYYALISYILQVGKQVGIYVIFSARSNGVSRMTNIVNERMTTHVIFTTSSLGYLFEEGAMMLSTSSRSSEPKYVKTPYVLSMTLDEIVKTAIEKEKQ